MKKSIFILFTLYAMASQAQEIKPMPMINVAGEGKIKVTPDQVNISVSVESKGVKAADVKKENDIKIDEVIRFIKKMKVDVKDFQTQRVTLNDQYDYQKKKHNYVAMQTIVILLKDLSKYDELMEGIVDAGINNINNVDFKSSKLEIYKSDARKLAMKDAKAKADDYTTVLAGQKVGKAFTVTDNTQTYYPQPVYGMAMMKSADMEAAPRETLAVGEIEIVANVSVSFVLE
ncbi:MAG: SIMPL domain-containing protein [Flavobacterium sp.]|nr:SIMPL domain-containing protein [Flavobacterium sp.]